MRKHTKAVTLLELLVAIALFGLIVVGFASIRRFGILQTRAADLRSSLQNEASYILENMTKEIGNAIGSVVQPAASVDFCNGACDIRRLYVWVDANRNGLRDPSDPRIGYLAYFPSSGYGDKYVLRYNPNCDPSYGSCNGGFTITSRLKDFIFCCYQSDRIIRDNFIDINLTLCWDPDGTPNLCGTPENPTVTMSTRLYMPSVSTH